MPFAVAWRSSCAGLRLGITRVIASRMSQRAIATASPPRNGGRPSGLSACSWLSKWDSFLPVSLSRILRLIARVRRKEIQTQECR